MFKFCLGLGDRLALLIFARLCVIKFRKPVSLIRSISLTGLSINAWPFMNCKSLKTGQNSRTNITENAIKTSCIVLFLKEKN